MFNWTLFFLFFLNEKPIHLFSVIIISPLIASLCVLNKISLEKDSRGSITDFPTHRDVLRESDGYASLGGNIIGGVNG